MTGLAMVLSMPTHAAVSRVWAGFSVAALPSTSTSSVQYTVLFSGNPTNARLDLHVGGSVSLSPLGGGIWQATLTAEQVLGGYTSAQVNHGFVGYLRSSDGSGQAIQYNVFINVVDENVPAVAITPLDAASQRTCRVVNYWIPDLTFPPTGTTLTDITRAFYADFGDDYEFVNILFTLPSYQSNRYHLTAQNQTSGLGLSLFDDTSRWGSAGRLLGVQVYPIDTYFDLGESTASHEIGHQWINFCDFAPLATSVPHWPIGTQARGVMGYSVAGGQGLHFPYDLELQSNGNYRMVAAPELKEFTDLDLYLMGLLPADQVDTNFVFSDPNQETCSGCEGPVTYFTVDDVIAAQGARVPAWPDAPRRFRVATIIASRDRLLDADEMAFFDDFTARGEAVTALPYTSGLSSGTTKPFYVATGGRGRLETALLPICGDLVSVPPSPASGPARLRIAGPHPIRDEIVLEWTQPRAGHAVIDLYAVDGRHVDRIVDASFTSGTHRARRNVPRRERAPGFYFARLRLDGADVAAVRLVVIH